MLHDQGHALVSNLRAHKFEQSVVGVLVNLIKRHSWGYIITIDLLIWCLGLLVVDGRVEGALRLFGVPRIVSLDEVQKRPTSQSLPERGAVAPKPRLSDWV